MSSGSDGKLSNQQLVERNRRPLSAPPQITVECPDAGERVELIRHLLAEQRRTNELLSTLPTREDAAAMQASLDRMLEAMQHPTKKPAGRKREKRSSTIWPKVMDWLWIHRPGLTWEWLLLLPLGGAAWLMWRLVIYFAALIEWALS